MPKKQINTLKSNEFRLDLLEYMKTHKDVEYTPYGLHAVVGASGNAKPGVIYVLKNRESGVNIDKKNRLHPFYLVYIDNDGQVLINHLAPKELLDNFCSLCRVKSHPQTALCKEFNKETRNGLNSTSSAFFQKNRVSTSNENKYPVVVQHHCKKLNVKSHRFFALRGDKFEKQIRNIAPARIISIS